MKEETLNKMRAAALSPEQLAAEIKRIDHAKTKATRPSELGRYDRKRAVYAAELLRQLPPVVPGAGETRGSTAANVAPSVPAAFGEAGSTASPGFPLNRNERPGTLTPDRTWS